MNFFFFYKILRLFVNKNTINPYSIGFVNLRRELSFDGGALRLVVI